LRIAWSVQARKIRYRSMKKTPLLFSWLLPVFAAGCVSVKTHSTIEPIHMTLDVNLKVQLEEELADAFADIDAVSETIQEDASQ